MSFWYIFKRMTVVHKCSACRRILSRERFEQALCENCEIAYGVGKTESCPTCLRSVIECTCQPKMLSDAGSLCLRKLYFYHPGKDRDPLNRLIYFLKHNRSRRGSALIAQDLLRIVEQELASLGIEDVAGNVAFVNVPRGRSAVIRDGVDQPAVLAELMAEYSGAVYAPAVRRRIGGSEQKQLNATQRKKNIKRLLSPREEYAELIRGRYVVLLDDIVTTGASMATCIPVLRKMGARGVICCSIAMNLSKKKE